MALAAAVQAGPPPAGACACGIALEAEIAEERALVVERPGGESIILSLDFASEPGRRAAVVLPVPGEPEVAAVRGGDPLAYLERATAPAPAAGSSGDDAAAGGGVDVIGRELVGGYDIARLGAANGAALDRWLDDNGYSLPAGAAPILSDYADQDWRFVAIRLAPGSEGSLKPLEVSFATKKPVYPMRLAQLGKTPISLTLFVLAPAERRVKGLERTFSGPVDKLEPPPPQQLEKLFASDGHVTRIEADEANFKRDLAIEPIPGPPGAESVDDEGFSTRDFLLVAGGGLLVLIIALILKARARPSSV